VALKQLAGVALLLSSCAPARSPQSITGRLIGTDGASHSIVSQTTRFTAVEFFSAHCPCQAKHDERLRLLAARDRDRSVSIVAVDSEDNASVERDAVEAARRRYPYLILIDPEGTIARAIGATYATYSVLVDQTGHVLYRGGIDSDRSHLREDATPYLQNAIDDALTNRPQRLAEAKTLGCSLRLR
jgi:hypothetical protein